MSTWKARHLSCLRKVEAVKKVQEPLDLIHKDAKVRTAAASSDSVLFLWHSQMIPSQTKVWFWNCRPELRFTADVKSSQSWLWARAVLPPSLSSSSSPPLPLPPSLWLPRTRRPTVQWDIIYHRRNNYWRHFIVRKFQANSFLPSLSLSPFLPLYLAPLPPLSVFAWLPMKWIAGQTPISSGPSLQITAQWRRYYISSKGLDRRFCHCLSQWVPLFTTENHGKLRVILYLQSLALMKSFNIFSGSGRKRLGCSFSPFWSAIQAKFQKHTARRSRVEVGVMIIITWSCSAKHYQVVLPVYQPWVNLTLINVYTSAWTL